MTYEDRLVAEAGSYELLPDYEAGPLEGPGRWAELADCITLYTNDDQVLFFKYEQHSKSVSTLTQALTDGYRAGQSATEIFDRVTAKATVVTGDLSELA